MVILRIQNKITDFFIILAWASPFKWTSQIQTFSGAAMVIQFLYAIVETPDKDNLFSLPQPHHVKLLNPLPAGAAYIRVFIFH